MLIPTGSGGVTPGDVVAFLGRTGDATAIALAAEHLPIVAQMVNAYTRGRGFVDGVAGDDLAAVIVSSCARSVANPEHTISQETGPFSIRQGIFQGWTLPELAILHRYRRRAL